MGEKDLHDISTSISTSIKTPKRNKWRRRLWASAVLTTTVLLLNTSLLIYGGVSQRLNFSMDSVDIYQGSRSTSKNIVRGFQFLINALSTLLLFSSTVCMRLAMAPSREDIDEAHARGYGYDIGVVSMRNFRRLRAWKKALVLALAFTSSPIHFFYNSVISQTLPVRDNLIVLATPSFVDGAGWSLRNQFSSDYEQESLGFVQQDRRQFILQATRDLQRQVVSDNVHTRWDVAECASAVAAMQTTQHWGVGNVAMIASGPLPADNGSVYDLFINEQPEGMMNLCAQSSSDPQWGNYCSANDLVQDGQWKIRVQQAKPGRVLNEASPYSTPASDIVTIDAVISHCLTYPLEPEFSVALSPVFLIIVIACGGIKLLCVLSMIRLQRQEPLLAFEDAVSSFLARQDGITAGWGAYSPTFRKHKRDQETIGPLPPIPRLWTAPRLRNFSLCGKKSWIALIFFLSAFAAMMLYWTFCVGNPFKKGNLATPGDPTGFWLFDMRSYYEAGEFGPASTAGEELWSAVGIANSVQLAITLVYAIVDNTLRRTSLVRAAAQFGIEWRLLSSSSASFSKLSGMDFRALVTFHGRTVFLMVFFVVLHWLLSESWYVIHLVEYDVNGLPKDAGGSFSVYANTQYSFASGIMVLITAVAVLTAGLFRIRSDVPLFGTDSLAISAACHRASYEDEEVVLLPVRYGVLDEKMAEGLPRVGFSAKKVDPLVEGKMYG